MVKTEIDNKNEICCYDKIGCSRYSCKLNHKNPRGICRYGKDCRQINTCPLRGEGHGHNECIKTKLFHETMLNITSISIKETGTKYNDTDYYYFIKTIKELQSQKVYISLHLSNNAWRTHIRSTCRNGVIIIKAYKHEDMEYAKNKIIETIKACEFYREKIKLY